MFIYVPNSKLINYNCAIYFITCSDYDIKISNFLKFCCNKQDNLSVTKLELNINDCSGI